MSKPIKLTDTMIQQIMDEFRESLQGTKMFDGNLNYKKSFKWKESERAVVVFSATAYQKMLQLLYSFDSEVAWHGTVIRDEENPSSFYIQDIFVYPQLVSGSTVETDQEEYQTWLYALEDDVFNNLRMQGHSHVNMGVTPSGVDTNHQERILEQLEDDMFYIFMIWNKRLDKTIKIYDLANNTLYDTADVDVFVEGQEFITEAKKLCKQKTYARPASTPATPAASTPAAGPKVVPPASASGGSAPKSKPKNQAAPPIGKSGANYDPGFDDGYGYPRGYWGY